jgi:hypothetical protein
MRLPIPTPCFYVHLFGSNAAAPPVARIPKRSHPWQPPDLDRRLSLSEAMRPPLAAAHEAPSFAGECWRARPGLWWPVRRR